MADIHIREHDDAGSISVVFHYAVPPGNNSAGVSWQTAWINSDLPGKAADGTIVSVLPDGDGTGGTIAAAELAALQSGTVLERSGRISYDPAATAGQLAAMVRTFYASYQTELFARLQRRLRWFGQTLAEA